MILNSPYISGSLTVTGNITACGGVTISGSIASASYAVNASYLNNSGSGEFVPTGSFNAFSSSILTYTGSVNSQLSALQVTSGSNITRLNSIESTTGSLNTASGSAITRLNALEAASGSAITRLSSLESASGSAITRLSSLESKTGSYATTGSNTFVGNQTITGSIFGSGSLTINGCITATGQIVAQTINVQQVTSSIVYSCGSNVFGTAIGNTQTLTGSVLITGSLSTIGNACVTSICSPAHVGGTFSGTTLCTTSNTCIGGATVVAGCIGVGTATPGQLIDVYKTSNDAIIKVATCTAGAYFVADSQGTDGYYGLVLQNNGTDRWHIGGYATTDFTLNTARTGGSRYLTINRATGLACFSSTVCAANIISSGTICTTGDAKNLDIGGVAVIRGNGGACTTHYFTTGAANVAKYLQYNATGTAINVIAADAVSYFNSGCTLLIGTTNTDIGGSVTGVGITANGRVLASISDTGALCHIFMGDRRGTSNEGPVLMLMRGGFYKSAIGVVGTASTPNDGGITFSTICGNDTIVERMRLTSAGQLCAGYIDAICGTSRFCRINQVAGNNTLMQQIQGAGTGYTYAYWGNNCGALIYGVDWSTGGALGTNSLAYSSGIYTATATALHLGTNQVVGLTIDCNNRVGIGTASPNTTLHVGGTTGDIAVFICSTCKTSNPSYLRLIGINSNNCTTQMQIVHRGNHSSGGYTDRIDFSVNSGIGWCERVIRLDFNGNVAMCEGCLSVANTITTPTLLGTTVSTGGLTVPRASLHGYGVNATASTIMQTGTQRFSMFGKYIQSYGGTAINVPLFVVCSLANTGLTVKLNIYGVNAVGAINYEDAGYARTYYIGGAYQSSAATITTICNIAGNHAVGTLFWCNVSSSAPILMYSQGNNGYIAESIDIHVTIRDSANIYFCSDFISCG